MEYAHRKIDIIADLVLKFYLHKMARSTVSLQKHWLRQVKVISTQVFNKRVGYWMLNFNNTSISQISE